MISKTEINLSRIKKNNSLINEAGNINQHRLHLGFHYPIIDFNVNATGTLNLLKLTKKHCSNIPFIFMSTNKVYGDNQNKLNLIVYNIIII